MAVGVASYKKKSIFLRCFVPAQNARPALTFIGLSSRTALEAVRSLEDFLLVLRKETENSTFHIKAYSNMNQFSVYKTFLPFVYFMKSPFGTLAATDEAPHADLLCSASLSASDTSLSAFHIS